MSVSQGLDAKRRRSDVLAGFQKVHSPWVFFPSNPLYSFPGTAIANYHKPGGLTEQKCILSQLWKQKVQNQVDDKASLLLKGPGKTLSSPLQDSDDSSVPWLLAA